ncbi:uncharacterized protein [Oscarella lobularis]|uniref:uncharacterized protein n=1 Tax=Oscarella lobularis TaxID=121494 RepID=UPI00331431FC
MRTNSLFLLFVFYANVSISASTFFQVMSAQHSPTKSSPRKRPRPQEFDTLSDIFPQQSGYKASVHGVIEVFSGLEDSPGKKFFDGYLGDESGRKRFVGFSPKKAEKIRDLAQNGRPVNFSNAVVQPSRSGDDMEVMITDGTAVWRSPRVFSNQTSLSIAAKDAGPQKIVLSELDGLLPYTKVSFSAGVVNVQSPTATMSGTPVQTITVEDPTGKATVNLWAIHVNTVEIGQCYDFSGLMVKEFGGENTLTTPKHNARIERSKTPVEGVRFSYKKPVSAAATVEGATVASVTDFSSQCVCGDCLNGHMTELRDVKGIGRCNACPTVSLLASCKRRVSAILSINVNSFRLRLHAEGDALRKMANTESEDDVTPVKLIDAKQFTLTYNNQSMTVLNVVRNPDVEMRSLENPKPTSPNRPNPSPNPANPLSAAALPISSSVEDNYLPALEEALNVSEGEGDDV